MKRLIFILILFGHFAIAIGQTPSPTPTASPQISAAAASPTPASSPDDRYLREGLKNMADDSRSIMGWGLTLIGASILAIVSTSYMRPLSRKFRCVYLLFIPGWTLVALSIYFGDKVSREYTAATFAPNRKRLVDIGELMNGDFDCQLTLFHWGLIVFAMWLLIYLIWWVVTDVPVSNEK